MRKANLLSTVAMALLLSAGAASAQGMSKDTPERAPAAQQSAPAEKVAPSIKSEQKSPATGHTASDKADKALNDKAGKAKETTGQSPKSEAGEKPENRSMEKSTDREKSGASTNSKTDVRSKSENSPASSKSTQSTTEQKNGAPAAKSTQSTTEQNRTTTGQGAAAGSAKLTTEQRTKISSVIKEQKVERVNLNVSVRVGTRIPTSVHVHTLPREVIVIYPEWRGYDYILVGDQIVIISPRTHEIVAIIDA